jgi:hypothetical protein
MFNFIVFEWRMRLFRRTVWCRGGFLKAFLWVLPSPTKVGPISGGIRCMRGHKIPSKGISSFVSATPSCWGAIPLLNSHSIAMDYWISPRLVNAPPRALQGRFCFVLESTLDVITSTIIVGSLPIISVLHIAVAFIIISIAHIAVTSIITIANIIIILWCLDVANTSITRHRGMISTIRTSNCVLI